VTYNDLPRVWRSRYVPDRSIPSARSSPT
jgi:hypothetical protein